MATDINLTGTNVQYEAILEAAQSISSQATADMQAMAAQQSARAARLTGVLERLKKNPQTPASTLVKLNAAVSSSNVLAQEMSDLATRIAQRPTVSSADSAVFGRVLDAKGAPVAGASVQLTDHSGKVKVSTPVKTDASGDFSLVLKACELPAGAHGLVATVQDASGAVQATSESLATGAGALAYTELSLKTANPPPKTVARRPKTKSS